MYEDRFANWLAWEKRGDYAAIAQPGVYAIAVSATTLAGRSFSWRRDIVYIGMTNAMAGLKGRLTQFDNTLAGKSGHGGADRVRFKHRNYRRFSKQAYVAVATFKCDPTSELAKDLRAMGRVARFEYLCLAEYVDAFGALPEFNNKKKSPKFSRTAGTRSRARRAT